MQIFLIYLRIGAYKKKRGSDLGRWHAPILSAIGANQRIGAGDPVMAEGGPPAPLGDVAVRRAVLAITMAFEEWTVDDGLPAKGLVVCSSCLNAWLGVKGKTCRMTPRCTGVAVQVDEPMLFDHGST